MRHVPLFQLWLVGLLVGGCFHAMGESPLKPKDSPQKKLIATGWDSPTPARFKAEYAAFERWGVFSGTTLAATRRLPDGTVKDCRFVFSREHWERSEFTEALADLKAVKPTRPADHFLFVYANPGDVDWFDDAGWREIVDHWRQLAWLAKAGGLRGLLYDAEPYTEPYVQMKYGAQPGRKEHSFEEYRVKARERGREVMRAVVSEYPEITVFTYRLLCDLLPAAAATDPNTILETDSYGLQPAFLDGWLDVMPPTVTLVEGNENAYTYREDADFTRAFTALKLDTQRLVSPENRAKFRAQVQVSHGIYLDAHVNSEQSPWYVPPLKGSRAARLEMVVSSALRAADEYVWIYGEKARWWTGGDPKFPLWPEALPNADRALRCAVDPAGVARDQLAAAKDGDNLLLNGRFDDVANSLPRHWWTWQAEKSKGRFSATNGMARLDSMAQGCFGQTVKVQPGERYALRTEVRKNGRGTPYVSVRWKSPSDQWTAMSCDLRLAPAPGNDWREVVTPIVVPEGAGLLVVLLGVADQNGEADHVEFRQVNLIRAE